MLVNIILAIPSYLRKALLSPPDYFIVASFLLLEEYLYRNRA